MESIMRNFFRKTLVCAAFVALQLALPVKNLHAGPFWDWLLGRPILTYPGQPAAATALPAVAAPVMANYPAAPAAGCNTCATPAMTSYLPVMAAPVRPLQYST